MFVKICGIRDTETARVCAELGVDAIGFVFAPGSVRQIQPHVAADIAAEIPTEIERVGVFTNADLTEVENTAKAASLTTIQFHGPRSEEDIHHLQDAGYRVIIAKSIGELSPGTESADPGAAAPSSTDDRRLLIDSDVPGSGTAYAMTDAARAALPAQWILAGGLTPENVAHRLAVLAPTGVDVSSGVESERGVKSIPRIREFVRAVRSATAPTETR